jgi:hypothetical protein
MDIKTRAKQILVIMEMDIGKFDNGPACDFSAEEIADRMRQMDDSSLEILLSISHEELFDIFVGAAGRAIDSYIHMGEEKICDPQISDLCDWVYDGKPPEEY